MIEASVSASASSATGPVQFGNVRAGSIGTPTWVVVAVVVVALAAIGGLIWYFKK